MRPPARSAVEPEARQVLVDEMRRRDLEALYIRAIRHDAVPPQRPDLVRLGIDEALLYRPHILTLLRRVRLVQHLVVDGDQFRVLVTRVVLGIDRGRQQLLNVHQRVYDAVAGRFDDDVEIALAHRVEPWAGRHDLLRHMQPDLAPLVDDPGRDILVGLIHVAVEQLERQTLGAGFFEQPPRLGARLLDVGPITRELLQLFLGRRQRRAGVDDAADGLHDSDLG